MPGRKQRSLLEQAIEELGPDEAFDLYSKLRQPSDTGDPAADQMLKRLGEKFEEQIQQDLDPEEPE